MCRERERDGREGRWRGRGRGRREEGGCPSLTQADEHGTSPVAPTDVSTHGMFCFSMEPKFEKLFFGK
jgi:hypothetical protein